MLCKTFRIRTTVGGGMLIGEILKRILLCSVLGFVVAAVLTLTLNTWSHWGLVFRVQVPNKVPGIWVIVIIVQVLVIRI